MKTYKEFDALCQKEWDERKGDICQIDLTENDFQVFAKDVLQQLNLSNYSGRWLAAPIDDLKEIINPVTQSRVKLVRLRSSYTVTVCRFETENVTISL